MRQESSSRDLGFLAVRSGELTEAARGLVERSCREQGLMERITDPSTLARIATVLRERAAKAVG